MASHKIRQAPIPMRMVGPVTLIGDEVNDKVMLPLATYETPLWPSVGRGARVASLSGGIRTTLIDERMSRSILLEAPDASQALTAWQGIQQRREEMNKIVMADSQFTRLIDLHAKIIGNLFYLRLEYMTGDASGHNMVTLASEKLQTWIQQQYSSLQYCSISGNYCSDKKASAVNSILGRGKNVVAETLIPRDLCQRRLRTTPEAIADLNIKKNLLGSLAAGAVHSANAHYANMLLAFYLATGQDAANIIEGSQGITHTEVRDRDLYFSVSLPNLIVGTVGNGKNLDFVKENLTLLGCMDQRLPGRNARRLACICAAAVLCGELSLLAAQTNQGELMASHLKLERRKNPE